MNNFKEDLQLFIPFLQINDNPDEIRKEYRRMVKLYHPDIAQENQTKSQPFSKSPHYISKPVFSKMEWRWKKKRLTS